MTQTAVREVARSVTDAGRADSLRSVVITLATTAGVAGAVLAIAVILGSNWIASSWVRAAHLSTSEIAKAIALASGILFLQMPVAIFNATLRGLQRQVLSNAVSAVAVACRGLVTIASLHVFGATPWTFFAAQLACSVAEAAMLATIAFVLTGGASARFSFDSSLIRSNWRFSSTMWLSSLVGQVTVFGDKLILSKMLPLDQFGLYSLVFAVIVSISRVAGPFTNSYFPYFIEVMNRQRDQLHRTFLIGAQLSTSIIVATGMTIALNGRPIMLLLTHSEADSAAVAPVFSMLAVANTIGLLIWMPVTLQLAGGVTWITLRLNLLQCLLYLPILPLLVPRYGLYAPAGLWLAVTACTIPAFIVMMRRVMPREDLTSWMVWGVLVPLSAAMAALVPGALLEPAMPSYVLPVWLAANFAVSAAAALAASPHFRGYALNAFRTRRHGTANQP
jgi:O-antigen/teichoic acid export membrane protein